MKSIRTASLSRPKKISRPVNSWRSAACVLAAAVALAFPVSEAHALAIGRITVLSTLGQPLRAEVDILNIDAEEAASLRAAIAPQEAFRTAGMDYNSILPSLRVTIQKRSDGRTVLVISSDRIVNEPFIDLILETTWATGRILRGYTLLFDPPKIQAAEAPAPVTAPVAAAPAPAPAAPTPAPAVATSPPAVHKEVTKSSGQHVVKPGDTAGRIASETKPSSVSLDQMLVALLRANPSAFSGGNINRLKAGATLDIPSAEQASAISQSEAKQTLVAQSRDFSDYRKKLGDAAPATQTAAADRKSGGQVKTTVEDKKGTGSTPDKLTLSKGTTQAKAADEAAKAQQKKEAAARVAELSKNIADLNKVKGSLTAASASTGSVAPAVKTAPASAATPSVVVATPAPAITPSAPPAAAPPAPPVVVAASAPALVAAPVSAAPAAKPKPVPALEPSFLDRLTSDPLIGGGAAALIAALGIGGFFAWKRRSRATGMDDGLSPGEQPASVFAPDAAAEEPAPAAGSSMIYSPSQLDSAGDVDPVAEADVYLAYGRDIQAEEILREALRVTPGRIAIHAKLLEIYAKRRDIKGFETLAAEAKEVSQGQGAEWTSICRLGRDLDSNNALYYPPGAAPTGATASIPQAGSASDDTMKMPAVKAQAAVPAASAASAMANSPDLNVDFDLQQLSGVVASAASAAPAAAPAKASPAAPAAAKAPAVDEMMLSFDLDAPASPPPAAPPKAASAPAAAPAPAPEAGMIEFDMGGLSLDLDKADAASGTDAALDENDPLAMKLALAEEFRAIGDDDGARSLLEEVITQAGGSLKARAQKVLSKLG